MASDTSYSPGINNGDTGLKTVDKPAPVVMKLSDRLALAALLVTGFLLRLYMAHLDHFLHNWDERFHALVARNLMDHPSRPMLRANPVTAYDPNLWCCNSLWLHKQPLFMWQMALSMKIFGATEITMRYPSVLMGTIMIFLVWRITILLTHNKPVAFIAGLLMCFSNYQLELVSGQVSLDHNDVAFGFYVLASIWAYKNRRIPIASPGTPAVVSCPGSSGC